MRLPKRSPHERGGFLQNRLDKVLHFWAGPSDAQLLHGLVPCLKEKLFHLIQGQNGDTKAPSQREGPQEKPEMAL